MSRVLVVGLGNDLHGDDAAGLLVARELRELPLVDVDVEVHQRDAVWLAESMLGHDEVLVIDAVDTDAEPGTVLELTPDGVALRDGISSHGLGLRHAVGLAHALGADPTVRVFGIAGDTFALGATPSPAVVAAANDVAARIREIFACA